VQPNDDEAFYARIVALSVPGHHERFFRPAGEPVDAFDLAAATPQAPDFARLAAVAEAAGFELLGPPPCDR
jgi:hypothetical protein